MTPEDEVFASDDLLLAVFKALHMQERHQLLPLVCKRWRRMVISPELLQQAVLSLNLSRQHDPLPHLRSLCAFLQRHAGQHLRGLRLDLECWLVVEEEAKLLISAGVSACAAFLEQLVLHKIRMPLSWVAGMVRLRSLWLHGEGDLMVLADLTHLTLLEQLHLTSEDDDVRLAPETALPPSLTFLSMKLRNPTGEALPPQLSALTNLRDLRMRAEGVSGHGYELLRGMPALRALELQEADEVPACLSSLASLESLAIDCSGINLRPLAAALPSLSLTQLVLLDGTPEVFAALSSQTRLRDFRCWRYRCYWDDEEVECAWLHGLRRLGFPAGLLEASMPALAHATCLETAQVSDIMDVRQLAAVLGWAVQRPALGRLDLCSHSSESDGGLSSADWNAMLRAQALRPDLRMRIMKRDWLRDTTELLAADDEE